MNPNTIAAKDVRPGMKIWTHGYKWLVKENHFDPYGNTGNQPRHVLRCDAVDNNPSPPLTYSQDMALGFLPNAPVQLADD